MSANNSTQSEIPKQGVRELTLLQQHNTCKPVIQVPEIHAADAALVVQFAVHVKRLVGLDLHLAHALARNRPLSGPFAAARADAARAAAAGLVERRVKLVGPRRAVAVAVAVVVAQQVVAARLLAALDRQRLVDRRQQVLGQVRRQLDDGAQVVGRVLGVEAAEQVPAGGLWLAGGVWGKGVELKDGLTGPNQRGQLPPS